MIDTATIGALEVFTSTGVERFRQEVRSTDAMLQQLGGTQNAIARQAYNTSIFPSDTWQNLNSMAVRIDNVRQRIEQIESNPHNTGTATANTQLEQLRMQLSQAVQEQERVNQAVQNMDVQAADESYMCLSQTIGSTERFIRDNANAQGRFNRNIQNGTSSAARLKNMITNVVGKFTIHDGLKKAKELIDGCTAAYDAQLNAQMRLASALANMPGQKNITQPGIGADTDMAAVTAAYDKITEKAREIQGNGIYDSNVMTTAAVELSTQFHDADAVEMMMGTLADYAAGMSGGSAVDAAGMSAYAASLGAMRSGNYDALTKSGISMTQAQKDIIAGEAAREQIVSSLGEEYLAMSADMQAAAAITQAVEKSSAGLYEKMSSTPQGKIMQMTNAWNDMQEVMGGRLYPYVLLFVSAITENWGTIQTVLGVIVMGLQVILGVLSWLLEGTLGFAQAVIDNWGWIGPLIYGIAAALAVYYGWQLLCAAAYGLMGVAKKVIGGMAQAQAKLNAVMGRSPIIMVVIAVIALIALFYALVGIINQFAGTSISATALICGAFMAALAFVGNIVIGLWNLIIDVFGLIYNIVAEVANFIGNVFNDPIGAVGRLFFGLADTVLGVLETLASAIDTIFGSNLSGAVAGWRESLGGWGEDTFGKGEEIIEKVDFSSMHMERFEYGAAMEAGFAFGDSIDEHLAKIDLSSIFGTTDNPSGLDFTGMYSRGETAEHVDEIAGNTDAIADSMDISAEELKYLHDIAEREAINRFTTAEITIEQTNHNNIKNGMDLDGILSNMTDMVNEAVYISTEGVHA